MYEVYKTRAIIFSKKKYLEKSKKVVVFSREFGFINIVAHGIFLEKSKNKSILQSGNLADIYMIKGKNKWIISGGKVLDNIFFSYGQSALKSLYSNMEIIKKNIIFDVVQKDIFNFIENKYFLNKKEMLVIFNNKNNILETEFNLENAEEILNFLGYLDKKESKISKDRACNINSILRKI